MNHSPLVSIIMPLYNCEEYVEEAVDSILAQTYDNWQLTIVDDCSLDSSLSIVQAYKDPRICIIEHSINKGAAASRNTALRNCNGRYVAFMDSDDIWLPDKLEKQVAFMEQHGSPMCFTAYETIEADGRHRNYVKVPERIGYQGFLKNTVTCSHTIVFDMSTVDKELLYAPVGKDYDFPEDMATWLQVLGRGFEARGLNEVLAKNRKHSESRSARKVAAVKRTWNQYRKGEGLSLPYSVYCIFWQLTHAVMKRL